MRRFKTSDGYTLFFDGIAWVDSPDPTAVDLTYADDGHGVPIDQFGVQLEGQFMPPQQGDPVTAENLLPLLREAVKAQLKLWKAIRKIEDFVADDGNDTLDDFVTGLAVECDRPADAVRNVDLARAAQCLAGCFPDREKV